MQNENQQKDKFATPFDHLNLGELIDSTESGIYFYKCTDLTIKGVCQVGTETIIGDASKFEYSLHFTGFEISVTEFLNSIKSEESNDSEEPSVQEKLRIFWRNLDLYWD